MEEGARRIKGNQIPEGVALGTLVGSESPCSKFGCDSWKTIGVEVDIIDEDGNDIVVYSVCMKHLPEFVEDMFLNAYGFIDPGEDCGNPDCQIHHPQDD